MMKYLRTGLFMALVATLLLWGACAAAETQSGSCGSNLIWTLDDEGTLTISGTGSIPSFYTDSSLPWGTSINKAIIAEGITSIGAMAFRDCSCLKEISIPESATSIGYEAFQNCSALTNITIPSNISNIGGYAFSGCNTLNVHTQSLVSWLSITFEDFPGYYHCNLYINDDIPNVLRVPDGISSIGNYAFAGIDSIQYVELPDGITRIGKSAFRFCSKLVRCSVPDTLESIEEWAFGDCSSLISFSIPNGITSIKDRTFMKCSRLSTINIPNSITSIGGWSFTDCSSLTDIVLSDNVNSIGSYAFSGCSGLVDFTIPKTIGIINNGTFYDCTGLTKITVPSNVTNIGYMAFSSCRKLEILCIAGLQTTIDAGIFTNTMHPTIYCYEFSEADSWATEENYSIVYLDDLDVNSVRTITLQNSFRLASGKSAQLHYYVFPTHDDPEISWQSSNPDVIMVDNGVATAISAGAATISATIDDISESMDVTVYVEADSFDLNYTEIWLLAKESIQLQVESIIPVNGELDLSWNSSDTSLADVDASGCIVTKRPGDVTITATSEKGVSRECLIHLCYPVMTICFEPTTVFLAKGNAATLTANVTARTQSFVNKLVTFESSDPSVATVDADGNVTGCGTGVATITATSASGKTADCRVVVMNQVSFLTLPTGLTAVEEETFMGDAILEAVIVPEGCASIGARAFAGCVNLIYVQVPAGTAIAEDAFEGCGDVNIDRVD